MLALDEEDYEALGYGAQRAIEKLAKHVSYVTDAKRQYMKVYMRQWRKDNPTKVKDTNANRWLNVKANPARYKKYKQTRINWYKKLKKDPARYAIYMKKHTELQRKRRGSKTTNTNKISTKRTK